MTASNTAKSRAIRVACKSRYSHAAIHEANGRFFEAIGLGVTVFNIGRFKIRETADVRVLRLGLEPGGTSISLEAARRAGAYVQRGYWYAGAIGSLLGNRRPSRREQFFCSYLVAQAYTEAKCPLVPGKGAYDCHPGDIEASRFLTDVTDSCLATVSEHVGRTLQSLDDGGNEATPVHHYHRRHTEILRRIVPAFRRHGLGYPVTVEGAVTRLFTVEDLSVRAELDQTINDAMDALGFRDLHSLQMNPLQGGPIEYPVETTKAEFPGTLREYRGLLQNCLNDIRDETVEAEAARKLYELTGLKSQLQIQQHYENRVRGMERYRTALEREIGRVEIRCNAE